MKIRLLLFLCFTISTFSFSQSFVNTQNKWHVADCCSNLFSGDIDCVNYAYTFGDVVLIDSLNYRPLITENTFPQFELGAYYREDNGKVYMKPSMNEAERLIYDFNLAIGETITINQFADIPTDYEVLGIDSIELDSGEKRKRLMLGPPSSIDYTFSWIEGIGGDYSPLNPEWSNVLDCWAELRCYYVEDSLSLQRGDCLLGDGTISTYELASEQIDFSIIPNPARSEFKIETTFDQVKSLQIYNNVGSKAMEITIFDSNTIQVTHLNAGVYYLVVQFDNGLYKIEKLIKH